MPPKDKKDKGKEPKEAKSKGGKAKKKKWSKAKTREKVQNLVVFDKATYDKLLKDIPSSKLLTPAVVSERLKVNGSLARRALKDLVSKGLIKEVTHHNRQSIYTRATAATAAEKEAENQPKKPEGGKGKQAAKKKEVVEPKDDD